MNVTRIIIAILSASSIWAQNTVAVSGKVTDVATGLPIEGAAVAITPGGSSASRQMHFTDSSGNYSFDEIASGTASAEIGAPGFLAFQKTNPDDVSIQIAADHAVHNFRLTPASSITGRIGGDGPGQMDRNIVATLFREDFTDGVRHFAVVGNTGSAGPTSVSAIATDGSYKFTGLEPGRYIIAAGPTAGRSIAFTINRSTGQVLPEAHPAEGYVQTFYPGTTEFAAAIPVSLAAGEIHAADFKVAWRPLFRASGEVVAPGGERWEGILELSQTGDGASQHFYSGPASVPGPFVVEGLPAGQYNAVVITVAGQAVPNGTGYSFSMRMMPVNLSVAITDHDVGGLTASQGQPQLPLEVHGFFRMATAGAALPTGLSVQYTFPAPGGESTLIPASDGGLFWLSGQPGDYSVRPVVPPGYAATAILYGGGNYLNSLIPVKGDSLDSSLTVVLTDQPGAVAGTIVDGQQKPVPARVVLAPDPLPADFDFRSFRVVSTDRKGDFALTGVAPGRYKAVALTGDDRKRDHDLAILGDKLHAADSFEVGAGQSVNITLRP